MLFLLLHKTLDDYVQEKRVSGNVVNLYDIKIQYYIELSQISCFRVAILFHQMELEVNQFMEDNLKIKTSF